MSIGDFTRIAQQPLQNAVVGQDNQGRIELQEPLKAPSKWTRFKAALSNVPLLGQIGTLQKARASVADYPVKLENYQATNRQILSGFVADLQSRFGEGVANMLLRDARPQDGAPLSQRTVATVIEQAEAREWNNQVQTNTDLYRFLNNPLQGGAPRGETDMTAVFLDMGRDIPEHCSSWQEAIGPENAKIVEGHIKQAIKEHPAYGQRYLKNHEIEAAARDALNFLSDVENGLVSAEDVIGGRRADQAATGGPDPAEAQAAVSLDQLDADLDDMLAELSSEPGTDAGVGADAQDALQAELDSMFDEILHSQDEDVLDQLDKELEAILAAANQRPKR